MLLVSWLRMNLTIVDPFQTGISQYRTDNTKVVKHSRAKSRQLRRLNRYESFFGRDQCTISRLSITSWFPREGVRHSHFAFMWLVCSTDRKQTTNKIERNVVQMWVAVSLGECCVKSQKNSCKGDYILKRCEGSMCFYNRNTSSYFPK